MKRLALLVALVATLAAPALAQPFSGPIPTPVTPCPSSVSFATCPTHVIVMVQENRTPDNLFQTMAASGADIATTGTNSSGGQVTLTSITLGAAWSMDHSHKSFIVDFDCNVPNSGGIIVGCAQGPLSGWDTAACSAAGGCPGSACATVASEPGAANSCTGAYTFVQAADVAHYTSLAQQYSFADHVLQANQGPSFPAHLYLAAAQAGFPLSIIGNVSDGSGNQGRGCGSSTAFTAPQADISRTQNPNNLGAGTSVFPCVDFPDIFDLVTAKGLTWKYYLPVAPLGAGSPGNTPVGYWCEPCAVAHHYFSSDILTKVVTPETTITTDITNGTLSSLSFVIPSIANSDHPGINSGGGPNFVKTVTDAIGASAQYYYNTVIIVVWDDWGGFYDHYQPYIQGNQANPPPAQNFLSPTVCEFTPPWWSTCNTYQFGARVPMIVMSPYAKAAYISHKRRSQASILRFIEWTFGLPTLTQMDANEDNLADIFNWNQTPVTYVPI